MINARVVTLADLLLTFIYLEVLAIVAMHLDSGKLPVRMPLYIAIVVALAGYLILDMKNLDTIQFIAIGGFFLIIAITVLGLRFGHCKLPYDETNKNWIIFGKLV